MVQYLSSDVRGTQIMYLKVKVAIPHKRSVTSKSISLYEEYSLRRMVNFTSVNMMFLDQNYSETFKYEK